MTGSMYASIAGLKAHMSKLSVIGNNVANVNTAGYKTQRVVFRDAVYNVYSAGSAGTPTTGSRNPSEIGYGSSIGSIDVDMSSATLNPGNPTDCAIVGDGFFLVGNKEIAGTITATDPTTFKSLSLTRVGDFKFGEDGYLVDGQGNCVYGFQAIGVKSGANDAGDPIVSDQLVPIRLPHMETITTTTTNADGTTTTTTSKVLRWPTDGTVDPATGVQNPDATATRLEDVTHALNTGTGGGTTEPVELPFVEIEAISIDGNTGQITGIQSDTKKPIVIGYLALGKVTNPNGVDHEGSSYYRCGDAAGKLTISTLGGVSEELGISAVNGSLYETDLGGGQQQPGTDVEVPQDALLGTGGNTYLKVGFLEAPNVDLATEISELITTQRGYQANTRIVTVTDTMLEELVNMKR